MMTSSLHTVLLPCSSRFSHHSCYLSHLFQTFIHLLPVSYHLLPISPQPPVSATHQHRSPRCQPPHHRQPFNTNKPVIANRIKSLFTSGSSTKLRNNILPGDCLTFPFCLLHVPAASSPPCQLASPYLSDSTTCLQFLHFFSDQPVWAVALSCQTRFLFFCREYILYLSFKVFTWHRALSPT